MASPGWKVALAVCAHPDDETFGLGAVITTLVAAGTRVDLLCLTHGEGSSLGAGADLAVRREAELDCAARSLGITAVTLLDHPDGGLDHVDPDRLADDVVGVAAHADVLLAFDRGGITGHPDHERATEAAVVAGDRLGLPTWAWSLPESVAAQLHDEFGADFVGRTRDELDLALPVDRAGQLAAMACHGSQLVDNPVPHRRIQLQGPVEHLRRLAA